MAVDLRAVALDIGAVRRGGHDGAAFKRRIGAPYGEVFAEPHGEATAVVIAAIGGNFGHDGSH